MAPLSALARVLWLAADARLLPAIFSVGLLLPNIVVCLLVRGFGMVARVMRASERFLTDVLSSRRGKVSTVMGNRMLFSCMEYVKWTQANFVAKAYVNLREKSVAVDN